MLEKPLVPAENQRPKQHKVMGKKHVIKPTGEESLKEQEKVEQAAKKEVKAAIPIGKAKEGRVCISSSYNNTIITLTDPQGRVISWASAGSIGFKGAKKATPFAASKVAETLAQTMQKLGIEKFDILVRGVGGGRESAIRSLAAKGFDIASITDTTPIPHGGCRPKKVRRV